MRKLGVLATLLALAALLLTTAFTGAAAAAPPSDADCKDIFIKANQQLLMADSYHMAIEATASMAMNGKKATIVTAGEFDIQVKPMLMKNTMRFAMDSAGKRNEVVILQYCEESDGKLVAYSYADNKWAKQIMPKPYPDEKYDELLKYCEGVLQETTVTFVRETDDTLVLEATITADSLRESFEKALALQGGSQDLKLPADLFQDVDDLKYTVVIDKQSQLITTLSMDMTEFLRAVGRKILAAAKMPEINKAPFRELLASGNVQINITLSRLNDIDAITIPKEARNAPLMTPGEAGKPGKTGKPDVRPPAAGSEATVKIGANLELTGKIGKYGQQALEGAQLAVDEVNGAGGIFGRQLELVARDNASQPAEAAKTATALINEDKVVAIVGGVTSAATLSAAAIAEQHRIPLITPVATNSRVTVPENGQPRKYVFRAAFADPFQGKVMSRFAADSLHAGKAAILAEASSNYSTAVAGVFKDHFTANGGQIVAAETYRQNDQDYGVQLMRIHSANPDVIFVPGYYQEVGLIIRQAREMGITAPILGADGWDSPRLATIAGPAALNDTYFSNHFALPDGSPAANSFVAAYVKKYSKEPEAISALGYDAVLLLAAAIKKAGTSQADKIAAALESVEIEGATGKITFASTHDPVKTAVVITFDNGRQTLYQRLDPK